MRSALLSATALCYAASAAADPSIRVYTYDPNDARAPSETPRELSPVAARVVLAQRAGVEDYHISDLSRDGVVDAINAFGTYSLLFRESTEPFFLHVPDSVWEDSASFFTRKSSSPFTISPPPSGESTMDLFHDLARQADPYVRGHTDEQLVTAMRADGPELTSTFLTISSVAEMERLQGFFDEGSISYAITVIVTPSGDAADAARDAEPWGPYAMPNPQSYLSKREQPTQEEPLEEDEENFQAVEQSSTAFETRQASNQSQPLPGILPACFPSQATCNSLTRNCTGHGSCALKYTDRTSEAKSRFRECYACSCSATTSKDSDGKISTTYWGGPACQKRDISMQFWLIALFSVGMVFLVSFAVGSVWSMGSEDLPSVIGAGVSGPVARR